MKRRFSAQERAVAVALALEFGKAEASRRLDINAGTIGTWVYRAGHGGELAETTRAATTQRMATMTERKGALATTMLGHAEQMLRQLDQPMLERVVKVLPLGGRNGAAVEIVEVEYSRPPTGDQKRIVEAVAILVDRIQLLTGEATSRPEMLGGDTPRERTQLVGVVSQLAERRVA